MTSLLKTWLLLGKLNFAQWRTEPRSNDSPSKIKPNLCSNFWNYKIKCPGFWKISPLQVLGLSVNIKKVTYSIVTEWILFSRSMIMRRMYQFSCNSGKEWAMFDNSYPNQDKSNFTDATQLCLAGCQQIHKQVTKWTGFVLEMTLSTEKAPSLLLFSSHPSQKLLMNTPWKSNLINSKHQK